jgi:mRNA-degrading endonuclease RelE of RelBE toxin-antitoxin system
VLKVAYRKHAVRALAGVPPKLAERIRSHISAYARNPRDPSHNAKRLQGQTNLIRLRVGEWRIIFPVVDKHLIIERIAPCGGA